MAGKPIGIFFAAWLAVRQKLALLPTQVTWQQIDHLTIEESFGVDVLGGIGFTMSLFITAAEGNAWRPRPGQAAPMQKRRDGFSSGLVQLLF